MGYFGHIIGMAITLKCLKKFSANQGKKVISDILWTQVVQKSLKVFKSPERMPEKAWKFETKSPKKKLPDDFVGMWAEVTTSPLGSGHLIFYERIKCAREKNCRKLWHLGVWKTIPPTIQKNICPVKAFQIELHTTTARLQCLVDTPACLAACSANWNVARSE